VQAQTTAIKNPQYGNVTKSDVYKTIAGGSENSIIIGPFKQAAYNDSNSKVKIFYKTGTGANATTWNALSTTLAGAHLLKIEILYLDN